MTIGNFGIGILAVAAVAIIVLVWDWYDARWTKETATCIGKKETANDGKIKYSLQFLVRLEGRVHKFWMTVDEEGYKKFRIYRGTLVGFSYLEVSKLIGRIEFLPTDNPAIGLGSLQGHEVKTWMNQWRWC